MIVTAYIREDGKLVLSGSRQLGGRGTNYVESVVVDTDEGDAERRAKVATAINHISRQLNDRLSAAITGLAPGGGPS